ncbi:MAG TPA: hypothetical protein VHM00_00495 [Caldimonas sp.]|jgi:hypothetical protein|nr:hypothetical protein [Caldimonas sp.]HEX2539542.1 hypothetical protein [Caldimonas sp.]
MSVPYLSDCGGPAQCGAAAAQARSPVNACNASICLLMIGLTVTERLA